MNRLSRIWHAFWSFVFSEDGFFTAAYLLAFSLYGFGMWVEHCR